ncbi:MAG: hypothetical protein K2Z80_22440 [Xanthobacteraceae bacterium]|nr:hypothetical protein [Xanthobacteraceae bacterium]
MTHFPLTPLPCRFKHGVPLTSLTLIDATTSAGSANVTAPSAIEAGDLLVFCDFNIKTSPAGLATVVIPSGFTQKLQSDIDTARRWVFSTKIPTGAEDSATLTGSSAGNFNMGKACLQFRGNRAIATVGSATNPIYSPGTGVGDGTGATPAGVTSGNPVGPVIVVSGAPALVLAFYHNTGNNSASVIDPRSFTAAKDGDQGVNGSGSGAAAYYMAWKFMTATDNILIDQDDEGQGGLGGFFLPLT